MSKPAPVTEFVFHPLAAIFPLLEGAELEALADDIRQHGLRDEIRLYEGKILDGRNRKTACLLAGVEPRFREFTGTRADALAFVWSENFHRRHLDPGKAAACLELKRRREEEFAAEVEKLKGEAAKQKSAGGKKAGRGRPAKQDGKIISQPIAEERKTTTTLARAAGTNRAYLETAAKLDDVELEAVRDGKKRMPDVIRERKREAIVAKLEDTSTKQAKEVQGLYDVLVIDPPWPMVKIERDERPNQSELDYPTMSEEELTNLSAPAADDCHVWLWTTHRFLPMAFRLLEAWGLKYVCAFVWHKPGGFQPIGLPQYNCEFALYARKGTPSFIDTKQLFTCFEAPRMTHSAKPDEFYKTLRRVTAGRRLDMFSRRKIGGFDGWGKEAA